jgi:hypothetical protein
MKKGDIVRHKDNPQSIWHVTEVAGNLFWTTERSQGMLISDFEVIPPCKRHKWGPGPVIPNPPYKPLYDICKKCHDRRWYK